MRSQEGEGLGIRAAAGPEDTACEAARSRLHAEPPAAGCGAALTSLAAGAVCSMAGAAVASSEAASWAAAAAEASSATRGATGSAAGSTGAGTAACLGASSAALGCWGLGGRPAGMREAAEEELEKEPATLPPTGLLDLKPRGVTRLCWAAGGRGRAVRGGSQALQRRLCGPRGVVNTGAPAPGAAAARHSP